MLEDLISPYFAKNLNIFKYCRINTVESNSHKSSLNEKYAEYKQNSFLKTDTRKLSQQ